LAAYVVDDATNMRYDVMRGVDGRSLLGGGVQWLNDCGDRQTFSVTLTPRPTGSVVHVFIPYT
jgi:hypothetical protein